MKFSKNTILILKNFASINDNIWFRTQGQLITVMKQFYNLIAIANIEDDIPEEFGIFDLPRFLGALSLFNSEIYNIELKNKVLIVTEGDSQQLKYITCEKKVLDLGPRGKPEPTGSSSINMPSTILAEFLLPTSALVKTLKISNVMSTFDKIAIKGENGYVTLNALNSRDPTTDLFSYRAGETNQTFNFLFPVDQFQKLMENDSYKVKIAKGIAQLEGSLVTYYLTPEAV